MKRRLHKLSPCSDEFFSIRRRFLDIYKQDVLQMDELKWSSIIQQGDIIAHEGDAVGDAILC